MQLNPSPDFCLLTREPAEKGQGIQIHFRNMKPGEDVAVRPEEVLDRGKQLIIDHLKNVFHPHNGLVDLRNTLINLSADFPILVNDVFVFFQGEERAEF